MFFYMLEGKGGRYLVRQTQFDVDNVGQGMGVLHIS